MGYAFLVILKVVFKGTVVVSTLFFPFQYDKTWKLTIPQIPSSHPLPLPSFVSLVLLKELKVLKFALDLALANRQSDKLLKGHRCILE